MVDVNSFTANSVSNKKGLTAHENVIPLGVGEELRVT